MCLWPFHLSLPSQANRPGVWLLASRLVAGKNLNWVNEPFAANVSSISQYCCNGGNNAAE